MATTKKITKKGTYTIKLNSKSKDMVYTISSSKIAKGVHFNIAAQVGYMSVYEKSGNNLMIYTVSESGKTITTKITNYYKYYPSNNTLLNDPSSFGPISPERVASMASVIDFSSGYTLSNASKYGIIGKKGNNYYDLITNKESDGIYELGGNDTYNITAVYGSIPVIGDFAGNDKYRVTNGSKAHIFDFKGNDNYVLNRSNRVDIEDRAGNDKYNIYYTNDDITITDKKGNDKYDITYNYDYVYITDSAGNDSYNISYNDEEVFITDNAGNDKYNAVNAYCDVEITDQKGNDSYSFMYSDEDVIIDDKAGNDKYKFNSVYYTDITEAKGNDTYTLKAGKKTEITDLAGKDTYNISHNLSKLVIKDGQDGSKAGGNDKYNLNYITDDGSTNSIDDYYGKETYNLNEVESIDIYDYRLNDVYNIKNTGWAEINDFGQAEKVGKKMDYTLANDKYNVTNSGVDITDAAGNDKYNFSYSQKAPSYVYDEGGKDNYTLKYANVEITDLKSSVDAYNIANSTASINDAGGNETYKISSSNATITDNGGTDTYKITSSNVKITDKGASKKDSYTVNAINKRISISDDGGSGDILTITGAKKGNIIFMADYKEEAYTAGYGNVNSCALFLFDKTNKGCIKIDNFFAKYDGSMNQYIETQDGNNKKGEGYIEKVMVGKSNISGTLMSYLNESTVREIGSHVAQWLCQEDNFANVSDLFANGTTEDISNFITYCVNNNVA